VQGKGFISILDFGKLHTRQCQKSDDVDVMFIKYFRLVIVIMNYGNLKILSLANVSWAGEYHISVRNSHHSVSMAWTTKSNSSARYVNALRKTGNVILASVELEMDHANQMVKTSQLILKINVNMEEYKSHKDIGNII